MTRAGRPRAYKTARKLQQAIDDYFRGIRRRAPVLDKNGEPFISESGEPAFIMEYAEPSTIAGLCVYMRIDIETFAGYQKIPRLAGVIAAAKLEIEKYNSVELLTRSQVRGIIFNLVNNFGWSDKKETEAGGKTRESAPRDYTPSLAQKRQLLREIAQAMAEDRI